MDRHAEEVLPVGFLLVRVDELAARRLVRREWVFLQLAQRGVGQGADESRADEHHDERERTEDDEHAPPPTC